MNHARNVTYRNLECHNTGLYGIYPVECVGVIIEDCLVTGTSDAGIYVVRFFFSFDSDKTFSFCEKIFVSFMRGLELG